MNGPLRIDAVTTPAGGTIGMVHCPGRCAPPWQRDLACDLATIKAWRTDALISLVEQHEFARLGVPQFADAVTKAGLVWHHVPIRDMGVPDGVFAHAWSSAGPSVMQTLHVGGRIVLHCAAGLGRTGTIAGKLLIALGVDADTAITNIRRARPGTIETADQEDFVRNGPQLTLMAPSAPGRRR